MKRIIGALAVTAALIAVPAVTAAASTTQATQAVSGPGWYIFDGTSTSPIGPLARDAGWTTSKVPAEIVTADGTIMVGDGTIPAAPGVTPGEQYPPWWSDAKAVQLNWADMTVKNALIQNVVFAVETWATIRILGPGEYAPTCLSYVNVQSHKQFWLTLDAADNWIGDSTAGC